MSAAVAVQIVTVNGHPQIYAVVGCLQAALRVDTAVHVRAGPQQVADQLPGVVGVVFVEALRGGAVGGQHRRVVDRRDVDGHRVGRDGQVNAAVVGTAIVAHLEAEGDRAVGVGDREILQVCDGRCGDFLSGGHGDAAELERARGGEHSDDHRLKRVAAEVAEARVGGVAEAELAGGELGAGYVVFENADAAVDADRGVVGRDQVDGGRRRNADIAGQNQAGVLIQAGDVHVARQRLGKGVRRVVVLDRAQPCLERGAVLVARQGDGVVAVAVGVGNAVARKRRYVCGGDVQVILGAESAAVGRAQRDNHLLNVAVEVGDAGVRCGDGDGGVHRKLHAVKIVLRIGHAVVAVVDVVGGLAVQVHNRRPGDVDGHRNGRRHVVAGVGIRGVHDHDVDGTVSGNRVRVGVVVVDRLQGSCVLSMSAAPHEGDLRRAHVQECQVGGVVAWVVIVEREPVRAIHQYDVGIYRYVGARHLQHFVGTEQVVLRAAGDGERGDGDVVARIDVGDGRAAVDDLHRLLAARLEGVHAAGQIDRGRIVDRSDADRMLAEIDHLRTVADLDHRHRQGRRGVVVQHVRIAHVRRRQVAFQMGERAGERYRAGVVGAEGNAGVGRVMHRPLVGAQGERVAVGSRAVDVGKAKSAQVERLGDVFHGREVARQPGGGRGVVGAGDGDVQRRAGGQVRIVFDRVVELIRRRCALAQRLHVRLVVEQGVAIGAGRLGNCQLAVQAVHHEGAVGQICRCAQPKGGAIVNAVERYRPAGHRIGGACQHVAGSAVTRDGVGDAPFLRGAPRFGLRHGRQDALLDQQGVGSVVDQAGHRGGESLVVGVGDRTLDVAIAFGVGKGVGVCVAGGDLRPGAGLVRARIPGVGGDRVGQAVRVGKLGGKRIGWRHGAADYHRAGLVGFSDRDSGRGYRRFQVAEAVRIERLHADILVRLGLGEDQRGPRGAVYVGPCAGAVRSLLPLVADGSGYAVHVGRSSGQGRAESRGAARCARHGYGAGVVGRRDDCARRRAGFGLEGAVAVGIAGDYGDGFGGKVARQHQRAADGTGYVGAVGLPLIADGSHAVAVGEVVAGGQRIALGRRAGDGDVADQRIVEVADRAGGRAGQAFLDAVAVGVPGDDFDGVSDLGFRRLEGAAGCAGDVLAVGKPLVAEASQAVGVADGVGDRSKNRTLSRRAGDGDGAARHVVEVRHRPRCRAGQALGRAEGVRVARADGDGVADFVQARREGAAGGAGNSLPVGEPLVAERAQAVGVGNVAGVRRQELSFGRVAGDEHVPGGSVVGVDDRTRGGACLALGRAVTVRVAPYHGDGLADLSLAEHERAAGGAGNIHAARLPLIAHRPHAVGVAEIVAGGEGGPLGKAAADGGPAGGCIVDVADGNRAAGQALSRSLAVGVAGDHLDGVADLGLRRLEGAAGCAGDVLAVGKPLVAEASQAVGVADGVGDRSKNRTLSRRAGDGDGAARHVVEVRHRAGRGAGQALRRAVPVRVAHVDGDGLADFVHARREGAAGRVGNRHAACGPLVAERTQAVRVGDAAGICGEGLSFGRVAGDEHASGRRVVAVDDRIRGGACLALGRAVTVRVAPYHGDGLADLSLAEHERAAGGAGNIHAARLPLIAHRPHAVGVAEIVAGGEGGPLGKAAADGGPAGGCIVDVADGNRAAGQALSRSLAVGVAGDHLDGVADLGLRRLEGAAGCAGDVLAVGKPLVAEASQAVGVADGVGDRSKNRTLSRRAGDGDGAARHVVEVRHRAGRGAGQALRRAVPVRVAHVDGDGLADFVHARREGAAGRVGNRHAAGGPLVAERAQPVGVVDAACIGGEGLSFGRVAGNEDVAGGRVVHVDDSYRGPAG